MKSKLIQKSNVKEIRQHSLPLLIAQQSLKPDIPIIIIPNNMVPININEISHKHIIDSSYKKNNQLNNQLQIKNSKFREYRSSQELLLQKLILSNIEIERLSNEVNKNQFQFNKNNSSNQKQLFNSHSNQSLHSEQFSRQILQLQKENKQLKQKYDLLAVKYQEGQKSYFQLNLKHSQLENELKRKNQIKSNVPNIPTITFPSSNNFTNNEEINRLRNQNQNLIMELNNKNNEITSIQAQLKLIKEEVFRIKAIQNQKKRLNGLQNNQVKTITEQVIIQKSKYSKDAKIQIDEMSKLKSQNSKFIQQVNQMKLENQRNYNENNKLKNQILFLKNELQKREIFLVDNQNLFRQIQVEKQNVVLYANQCHRLANQLLNSNNLREKEKKQWIMNNQSAINQKIKIYRQQIEKIQKQNRTLKQKIDQLTYQLNIQKNRNNVSINESRKKQENLSPFDWKFLSNSKNQTNQIIKINDNFKDKYQLLCEDYQRLRTSKQNQINLLNDQIKKLRDQLNYEQLLKFSHEKGLHNSDIKFSKYINESMQHEENINSDNTILKKHLQLSVKQLKQLYDISKITNEELMKKVEQYHQQKNDISKKLQYQQFELAKLYQVLQTRREQLELCYKTIQNLRKGSPSPIMKQDLNQILRDRREQQLF